MNNKKNEAFSERESSSAGNSATAGEETSAMDDRISGNVRDAYGVVTGSQYFERESEMQSGYGSYRQISNRMLTGIFRDRESAERAYNSALNRGYSKDDISLLMSDDTRDRYFSDADDDGGLGSKALEGAGAGSAIGGTLGAIIGGTAAIGTNVLLPGLGLVVAGPLAAALAGAGAGGLTGGLVGALIGSGIPEDRALEYEEGIRNGGIVMSITTRSDEDADYYENEWRNYRGEHVYGRDTNDYYGQNSRDKSEKFENKLPEQSLKYKQISAWISERKDAPKKPLYVNETYTLNFIVGSEQAVNLLNTEKGKIPDSDIPEDGLDTEWVIITKNVVLSAPDTDVEIVESQTGDSTVWTAKFSLHIHKSENSRIARVKITPLVSENAELQIIIFAEQKIYRQFMVELNVEDVEKKTSDSAAKITNETIFSPANELRINPSQEWTTPLGNLTIAVSKDHTGASLSGFVLLESGEFLPLNGVHTQWYARKEAVNPLIIRLRGAAKDFCDTSGFNEYLNDIPASDLVERLTVAGEQNAADNHSFAYDGNAGADNLSTWNGEIASSEELRRVASFGYLFYNAIFPANTELREWLDALPAGWRINVSWSQNSGSAYIPNIPWGMLYNKPPEINQPIDATRFWGLRFRLEYTAYDIIKPKSKALGDDQEVHKAGCFYWGDQHDDDVTAEARWQQSQWKDWTNQKFIPGLETQSQMSALLSFLQNPAPSPLRYLYFYCHCRIDEDKTLSLRFGNTNQSADLVDQLGLGLTPIADRPVVFVNACSSAAGDVYDANQVVETFMGLRGCRAFVGTEIDMPVDLASRFALIFSYFFFRRVTTRKITAGEAFYQARLFLWHHYRNIGGIFYTYINEYDLYMGIPNEPYK